jgi:hypothetical chaperone protein
LYLERHKQQGKTRLVSWTGPEGIEHYLSRDNAGRLIQSLKSFLTSRTLLTTEVFGVRITIEELIARILRDLREKAQQTFGVAITSAVVGRPVRFVGAETEEDNLFAEGRLRTPIDWPDLKRSNSKWNPWPQPIITNPPCNRTNSY